MKKGLLKRVIALLTVVVLIAGFAFPVGASDESGSGEEILSEEESEEIVTTPEPTAEPTAEPTEEPTLLMKKRRSLRKRFRKNSMRNSHPRRSLWRLLRKNLSLLLQRPRQRHRRPQ